MKKYDLCVRLSYTDKNRDGPYLLIKSWATSLVSSARKGKVISLSHSSSTRRTNRETVDILSDAWGNGIIELDNPDISDTYFSAHEAIANWNKHNGQVRHFIVLCSSAAYGMRQR